MVYPAQLNKKCTFDVSVFIFTAQAAGDPHLTTLDRKDYTFNGIGDFVLLQDVNSSMVVQVRAVQTKDTDGESCKIYKNKEKVLSVSGIKTFIDQIILGSLIGTVALLARNAHSLRVSM